jgi:adenylate kinase family enzyme
MFGYNHLHIVGASGAGTTTLASALAGRIDARHLDTDDYYWLPTSPPYREKRPAPERLSLLRSAFAQSERWILSGSLLHWGVELSTAFDLVIFLHVPPDVRLARTLAREHERYGARIEPGGEMRQAHLDFLEWSRTYDTADTPGRNLVSHRAWLSSLSCAVLEIAGEQPVEDTVAKVLAYR